MRRVRLPFRAWSACLRTARLGMDEFGGPTLAGKDPVVRRLIAVEKRGARPRL